MDTRLPRPRADSFLLLIDDLVGRLDTLLVALGKHAPIHGAPMYVLYCAGHILRCSAGYSTLRKAGNDYAARMLARPIIEALFRLRAVHEKPELLYPIAYSEHLEDIKFVRALTKRAGRKVEVEKSLAEKWEEAEKHVFASTPPQQKMKKSLTSYDAAEAGDLLPMYNLYYRLYCQHTHASLRAMQGTLDGEPEVDEFAISTALRTALECCAKSFPVRVEMQDLIDRHTKLTGDSFTSKPAP